METLEECRKSQLPLREREEYLIDAINELDAKSLRLYRRITDRESFSKEEIESLYEEIVGLQSLFAKVVDASDYLDGVEENSYSFAYLRLRMKTTLTLIAAFYSSTIFPPLGFLAFTGLYPQVKKHFLEEITEIEDIMKEHSVDNQFVIIQRTLENCCKYYRDATDMNPDRELLLKANNYILIFLTEGIPEDEVLEIPQAIRNKIAQIIQEDGIDCLMKIIEYLHPTEIGYQYGKENKNGD